MGRRTQAERDAVTVEIGYALVSGAVVAGVTFAGILAPALLLDLPRSVGRLLFAVAAGAAALVFAARVVHVLWRFPRAAKTRAGACPPARPGRPGRTSPGS